MKRFSGRFDAHGLHAETTPCVYGGLELVWNGYLANREELRDEARRRGERLLDGSDGELLAKAYTWWNSQLSLHVVGQYSVVLFDSVRNLLLLTHDSLGLASLFYRREQGELQFASHLEDLVALGDTRSLNDEYLADYVAHGTFSGSDTPFRDVQRLALGQDAVLQAGRLELQQVWTPQSVRPVRLANPAEYAEQFREILSQAVAAGLEAEGPVWSELSGGLDSSSITSLAANSSLTLRAGMNSSAPLSAAFSIVFPRHPSSDETGWIRMVLDKHNLPWQTIDGDDLLPFGQVPDRPSGEPRFSLINWGWLRAREALLAEQGVSALLTGQGGDLVCLGPGSEPYYLADRANWLRPWHGLSELSRWQKADPGRRSLAFWFSRYVLGPALRHALGREVSPSGGQSLPAWLHPQFVKRMDLARRARSPVFHDGEVGRQWFWERIASMSAQVANQNQDSVGFELRHPFLHRPLVEFVSSIPWEAKLDPRADRVLQRAALADIVPAKILSRRGKATFDQPSFEGLRQSRQWLHALTVEPRIADLGIVDGNEWAQAVARARLGAPSHTAHFIAAATLEIWLRQLEQIPIPSEVAINM